MHGRGSINCKKNIFSNNEALNEALDLVLDLYFLEKDYCIQTFHPPSPAGPYNHELYPVILLGEGPAGVGIGIPNPNKDFRDLNPDYLPQIVGLTPVMHYKFDKKKKHEFDIESESFAPTCQRILTEELTPTEDIYQTLFLGISTKSNIQDIMKKIKVLLKTHTKPNKKRRRGDKWKYYLIVHDLKKKYPDIEYNKIAELLIDAYPFIKVVKIKQRKKHEEKIESSEYFTPQNCKNYHTSSLALISGEYKRYLNQ